MKYIQHFRQNPLRHIFTTPFVLVLIVPLALLDLFVEIYHRICFPCYGLPYIRRSQYIVIDRHRLSYLGPLSKIFCAYCGYANGLLAYMSAIAAATESYFCHIQHEKKAGRHQPTHHQQFLEYGDEKSYEKAKRD